MTDYCKDCGGLKVALLPHKHCIRASCQKPMPVTEEFRDGVCWRCSDKEKPEGWLD